METRAESYAESIRCEVRIPLRGDPVDVPSSLVDLSRIGIRLVVPVNALGLPPEAAIEQVDDALKHLFATGGDLALHTRPERATFRRRIHGVHCEHSEGERREVELLCVFDAPLAPHEARTLGLAEAEGGAEVADVPMRQSYDRTVSAKRRAAGAIWSLEVLQAAGRSGPWADGRSIRARVAAEEHPELPSFDAYVEALDPQGVDVVLPDRSVVGLPTGTQDAHELAATFLGTYGQKFVAGLRASGRGQWMTRVELETVSVPENEPDAVRLGCCFIRPMRGEDVRRLHGNA